MKHEIGIGKPAHLEAAWPGKYELFSWLEYAVNIPYPVLLVTTLKANGAPNACLHSWGCFGGDEAGYCAILTMLNTYHTFGDILRTREWCINVPSSSQRDQCMATIENNAIEADEITASGFTVEPARVVDAPRIAECLINLECRLSWDRPLFSKGRWHVFAGEVVHLAIDDDAIALEPHARMQALQTMYNMRATLDPLTGRSGASSLPVLGVPNASG